MSDPTSIILTTEQDVRGYRYARPALQRCRTLTFSTTPTPEAPLRMRFPLPVPLTPAQATVACLLAEGWERAQIAAWMGISERGVRFHVERAARKVPGTFDAASRLVLWWRGADFLILTGQAVVMPPVGLVPLSQNGEAGPADPTLLGDAVDDIPED